MSKNKVNEGGTGYILFTAWVGALVYFVQQSDGFWGFFVAIFKACVWPAYVMFEVLKALGL